MIYTRDDLRDAVLQELGVVDPQDAPSAQDAKIGDDRCQQQLEALYDAGIIPFDLDADAIPARYFVALTQVIADKLAMPYGVGKRAQMLALNARKAMVEMHRLNQPRYLGEPQKVDYF